MARLVADGQMNARGPLARLALAAFVALGAGALADAGPAAAAEQPAAMAANRVLVEVDRAQLLRLDQPASAIIIGNPLIADAAVHDNKMLVITGKSFGSTNLIVLDSEGNEILTKTLEVRVGSDSVVTMHKGALRQSYSCSPLCEPTLLSGDSKEYFDLIRDQIVSRNESSAGSGTATR